MEFNFNSPLSNKSEAELLERVENREKYMPDTVKTAIAELRQRGHLFTEEELIIYNEDIQEKLQNAALENKQIAVFNKYYKDIVVEDPDAPLLYSRRAVYLFSFFCGAFFGSIMLAVNSRKIEKSKQGTIWIILFGIVFTITEIVVGKYINAGNSFTILCGLLAAYSLNYFFWNRYMGEATFYRARSIWIPLIIALFFAGFTFLAIFYNW